MERFVLAKHWGFFVMSFAVPLILFLLGWFTPFYVLNGATVFVLIPLSIVIAQLTIYFWLWGVGKYFKPELPKHLLNKFNMFKWFVRIPVYLIVGILIYLLIGATVVGTGKLSFANTMGVSMYAIIPLWFLLLLSKLFCFYYISRVIQSMQTIEVMSSKSIFRNPEFFLILVYPVGIWFLQPKLNKIAKAVTPLR